MQDVNLLAMRTIKENFPNVSVGYSDHTQGIHISVAAVALGAEVVEKHFTLDRDLPGPDHKASIDPVQLAELVNNVRDVEQSLGDGVKKISASEAANLDIVRKSIVAATPIKKAIFLQNRISQSKDPELASARWTGMML